MAGQRHQTPSLGDGPTYWFRGRLWGLSTWRATAGIRPAGRLGSNHRTTMTEETLSSPTSDIGSTPSEAPSRPRRWWPWITLIVAAIVIALASRVNLNYYAVQPGVAQPVQQFIRVPADKGHPVTHSVLLTDVEVGRVWALSYLYFRFQGNTELDPLESAPGGTPPSEYTAQGDLEMTQAESAAKTAALRRLGYPVTAQPCLLYTSDAADE